jgi:hypothetical protein
MRAARIAFNAEPVSIARRRARFTSPPSRHKCFARGRQFGAMRFQASNLAASALRNAGAQAPDVLAAGFAQFLFHGCTARPSRRRRSARRRRRIFRSARRRSRPGGRRWRIFRARRRTSRRRRRRRIFGNRRGWGRRRLPEWPLAGTRREQKRGCSDQKKALEAAQVHRTPRGVKSPGIFQVCK